MRIRPLCSVLLGLVLLGPVVALLPAARADDEPINATPARPATEEEEKEIEALLKKVARKRDEADILPVLDRIDGLSSPVFHKYLVKLLTHDSMDVALRAGELLEEQLPADEKAAKKLANDVWKYGWTHASNQDRLRVKGQAIRTYAALAKEELSDRDFKQIEKLWRWATGSPSKELSPVLADICAYVRMTKDKRLCRFLGEEIDEPGATDVNSGTNPPAEWWKARWEMWNGVKSDVHETLKALTGRDFKSTEEAKAWFEENEREFGFRW